MNKVFLANSLLTILFSCSCPKTAEAVVLFDDGGTHIVDYLITGSGEVRNDFFFGTPTAVEFVTGGGTTSYLYTYDDSQAIVSDGNVGLGLWSYDNSKITLSGGSVGSSINAYDDSQAVMDGGIVKGIEARDNSQFTLAGGTVENYAVFSSTSLGRITGGTIDGPMSVRGPVIVSGGVFNDLLRSGSSSVPGVGVLTFVGSDFTINGNPVPYGEYNTMGQAWVHGTLAGTLANGDLLDNEFYIYNSSKIILSSADFNEDGDIDGGDFLAWQRNFGTTSGATLAQGDANASGVVNGDDLLVWEQQFGSTPAFAVSFVVPEPSSILLVMFGIASLSNWRQNR